MATAADLNGDDQLDVAVIAGSGTNHVLRVFLGNSDDTFTEPRAPVPVGRRMFDIGAGDVTGDGALDLILADNREGLVLEGNGDGTFDAERPLLQTGSAVRRVSVGDFDGDGRDDVLSGFYLVFGDPSRPFALLSGLGASPLAAVDLDGDGKLDIFTGRVLARGNGDGTFTYHESAGAEAFNVAFADFDADGNLDVAATDLDVVIHHGLAPFRFTGPERRNAERSLVGDLNGDGRADVVAVDPFTSLVYLAGVGGTLTFTSVVHAGSVAPAIGDFDGDRNLDLFFGVDSVAFGNGDGTFDSAPRTNSQGNTAIATDMNGDGRMDVASTSVNGVTVHLNDGTGRFASTTAPFATMPSGLAAADFNGDGTNDLVVSVDTRADAGELHLLDGKSLQTPVRIATGVQPHSVAAADVGGDGHADLVTLTFPVDELLIFAGNGNGTFRGPARIEVPSAVFGAVTVADFSGDGRADIAAGAEEWRDTIVFVQQHDGSFVAAAHPFARWRYAPAHAADVDGDGRLDLVTSRGLIGGLSVHLNRCPEELRLTSPAVQLSAAAWSVEGSPATFTATISGGATGTVLFYRWTVSGGVPVGSAPVTGGEATITTAALPRGVHEIYAVYLGDGAAVRSRSATLQHAVTANGGRTRSVRR